MKGESLTRTPVEQFLIALDDGDVERVRELLQTHAEVRAAVNEPIIHGSVHGWATSRGDFPATARLLLDAGERLEPSALPTGRDDVDAVLRAYLASRE